MVPQGGTIKWHTTLNNHASTLSNQVGTLRNHFGSRPVASRCPTRGAEPCAQLADIDVDDSGESDADDSGESDASEPVEESTVTAVGAAMPSEGALLSLCFLKCACQEFYADADSNGHSCGSDASWSEVCGCG